MKVSVLIPTNRLGGLELAARSLVHQTFTDFEVLVGSPFDPGPGPWRWIKDDFQGGFWTLCRIYNRLIDRARGELLVSLQDYIWVPPTGIERFVLACDKTHGGVTGVSDQFTAIGLDGKPGPMHWRDVRRDYYPGTELQAMPSAGHEWNWSCTPKTTVLDVGGFDEEMDFIGYCGCAISVVERLYDAGVPLHIDPLNEVLAQTHGRPVDWDDQHAVTTGRYETRKAALKASGCWPRLSPRGASSSPPR